MAYVKRTNGVITGVRSHNDEGYEFLSEDSQEWADYKKPLPTSHELKLIGFEFEGVMCSATGIDASGMLEVARAHDKGILQPTMFYFKNGNTLVITNDNFEALEIEFSVFRASFYKPE